MDTPKAPAKAPARRKATDADLSVGAVVYRGAKSKKAWTISRIFASDPPHTMVTRYTIDKGDCGHAARNLWVEA